VNVNESQHSLAALLAASFTLKIHPETISFITYIYILCF